jgi:hypothetical protein
MEIILGILLGALLGGTTIYFLVKPKSQPEQQSPTLNSSRNLILKLIQSLPDIVIWVDGDNKIKYASEVALNLNIAREDKIQIDALETLISMARKIDEPLIKKVKAKRPLGIAKLNLDTWVMRIRARRSFTLGSEQLSCEQS